MKYYFGFTDAKDPEVKPCCDIDVAGIFAANHQKAVELAKKAAKTAKAEDLTITNSALSEDGTKLASAGEHIVCATLDRVKDDDVNNAETRKQAVEILKVYAKQFSGEDDLDEKKIYSLQEEGDQPKAPEPEPKKEETSKPKDDTEDPSIDANVNLKESTEESKEESSIDSSKFVSPDGQSSTSEENKQDSSKEDASSSAQTQTKLGYYFVYKLKVEGIKESTFIDALKKMSAKVIDGFDMKVKFTSLFGGGGDDLELSGKKMRQWFQADIDPDKLVNVFDDKIQKKFPSEKYGRPDVTIYDKNLIIKTLGGLVGAQDKKKILDADYSIAVKFPSSNKSKELIKPAFIASLMNKAIAEVQPSRKGKNKISAKDVIVVSNSKNKAISDINSKRQSANEPEENSIMTETYYQFNNVFGIVKDKLFEDVDNQRKLFDLFFEEDANKTKTVTIRFKKPRSWDSPKDNKPEDFESPIVKVVSKGLTFGSIKKDADVETAEAKAQSAFSEFAVFDGWTVEGSNGKSITDREVFNQDTTLIAKYKQKKKADAEDDLKSVGKDFDYYVIPMPGLKYPTKDDER